MSRSGNEMEALQYYKHASELEADGRLGEAIALYQRAFKLSPYIEDLVRRHDRRQTSSPDADLLVETDTVDIEPSNNPAIPEDSKEKGTKQPLAEIENLVEHLESMEISCEPDRRHKGMQIFSLPAELIINGILRFLVVDDVYSVEMFASTCRLFFLCARDVSVWRRALRSLTYNSSGSVEELQTFDSVDNNNDDNLDVRSMFLRTPRIRFDGIYIATCLYWRQGQNESAFNQPIHAVTYYRYLRLLKNGTAYHALSNDEPAHVVPLMKRSRFSELLRQQQSKSQGVAQIMTGTWNIASKNTEGNNEHDLNLVMKSRQMPDDLFVMNLKLLSGRRSAWNKLKWMSYESHRDQDILNFPLDHVKSFMFSRVKSYLFD